jgi:hypothetical protein
MSEGEQSIAADLDENILRLIILQCLGDAVAQSNSGGGRRTTLQERLRNTNRTPQLILNLSLVNKHWRKVHSFPPFSLVQCSLVK